MTKALAPRDLSAAGSLTLPTAAASAVGMLRYDSGIAGLLRAHDGTREKPVSPVGWAPYAYPVNHPNNSTFGTGINVAAVSGGNGGAILVPILVPAPLLLQSVTFRNTNTSQAKTAEARIYLDGMNAATADFLTGSDCTWSFTPSAAADQTSGAVSGAGTCIVPPGIVWLVFRNTSAGQTIGVGSSGLTFGTNYGHWEKAIASLGSTIDAVTSWTATGTYVGFRLDGRVLGRSTAPA